MLYREIIAVCSEIHIKHKIHGVGQNVTFVSVKLVVHEVTIWAYRVNAAIGTAL